MHATGVTAARCVAALAPRCAFSLPLPFRFGVTTHFLTRAMRRRSRASARTRRPRRRTSLTSGASSPSSRNRRCAPTARGGYPRVRGGPHLAGACPDGRGNNTLENPGLTACVATFPNEPRLVTSRHAASHGSPALALDPADARFPANPPHDTPHRFARALERLPAQPRARGGRPRHVHGCVPRPFTIVFSAFPKIFPIRCAVFGDCHPYARAPDISDFFPRDERTVVFFVVSFFSKSEKNIHLRRRDGRRSPRARDERHVSADGIHAMSFVFVSFATNDDDLTT